MCGRFPSCCRMAATGLRQAAEDAVLNANYVRASLADLMSLPFGNRPCMHEALFDDSWLKGTGVSTLDFAKAMIDEGFHPMTVYFPLVVHGAMLIEPTESESKASLDLFIATLRDLAMRVRRGEADHFTAAPALRSAPPARRDAGRRAIRSCAGKSRNRSCRARRRSKHDSEKSCNFLRSCSGSPRRPSFPNWRGMRPRDDGRGL